MTDEEEPSPQYLKGYNHGYQLAAHEPELLNKLLQAQGSNTASDYVHAIRQGKEQFEREKLMKEMKAIRDQRKQTIRRRR
ncbi:hypothetical protein ACAW74_22935 [Fibrella sp. WM1]|uniref:hypothetical protein n=1 Tax=Fibrella musci TaxID=3242485 RepID=UPI003520CAE5